MSPPSLNAYEASWTRTLKGEVRGRVADAIYCLMDLLYFGAQPFPRPGLLLGVAHLPLNALCEIEAMFEIEP